MKSTVLYAALTALVVALAVAALGLPAGLLVLVMGGIITAVMLPRFLQKADELTQAERDGGAGEPTRETRLAARAHE